MGLGQGNPLPFQIGGQPTDVEQTNSALKQAVGVGGSAEDGTIEAEWRFAKARGLAAAIDDEGAVMNGWPDITVRLIEMYEDILTIFADPNASDEERRQEIIDRWVRQLDATVPGLDEVMQEVDPLFSVQDLDFDRGRTTVMGRAFEDFLPGDPLSAGPAFGGGRTFTSIPNYSDEMMCRVKYDIPTGTITNEQKNRIKRVEAILNEILPSWVGFSIFAGNLGFLLDISLLDLGAFD
jgi:hypothetical protein